MPFRNTSTRSVITPTTLEKHLIPNNAPILNVLVQMKNDNKSDYTIDFTRKALNLGIHRSCCCTFADANP